MRRRSPSFDRRILAFALAVGLLLGGPTVGRANSLPVVTAVESVGMTVADLDRSVAFFTKVLDFKPVTETEVAGEAYERLRGVFALRMRIARLRLGDEDIELTEYLAPRGRAMPSDSRANDRWFQHLAIIVSDIDRAYARLRENRVEHASSHPQTLPDWNVNAAGIRAFYFRDPDGHFLEVLQFPPGKGDPKWQRNDGRLFLGIDHTAVVVADTDASLGFYRDTLGLKVVGESENHGGEQEHLNGVFAARLRITTLRAASGPGIELLEYLAPRDGRDAPQDLRANDIAHWQTRLLATPIADAQTALRERRYPFVSPGVIDAGAELGFVRGMLARDPDGHAIELVER
jgi:catechol 2,3-dioxygenase-like lactoylglutathione lyase family enzyme